MLTLVQSVPNNILNFKKGDISQPYNYRLVALWSSMWKLQDRIMFKNMYNVLIDNNLLYKYQSGFHASSLNSVSFIIYVKHLIITCFLFCVL